MSTIKLDIVSAERLVFSEDVEAVVAPGVEGQLGILPHHAPLMTAYESARVETVMKETGWTRQEIFEMAMEAWSEGLLGVTMVTGQQRWTREEYLPDDLSLIGVYSQAFKKQYRRNIGLV